MLLSKVDFVYPPIATTVDQYSGLVQFCWNIFILLSLIQNLSIYLCAQKIF